MRTGHRLAALTGGAGLGLAAALSLSPGSTAAAGHAGMTLTHGQACRTVSARRVTCAGPGNERRHTGRAADDPGPAGRPGTLAPGTGQAVGQPGTPTAASAGRKPGRPVRLTAADGPSPAASRRRRLKHLPDTGFDGIAVAAVGTALTAAGWLLLIAGSRRLRR